MTPPLLELDEIVIGLTAPVGVPFKPLEKKITSFFESQGFFCSQIKASTLLLELQCNKLGPKGWEELDNKQFLEFAGDVLRFETKSPEVLSLLFIQKIRQIRKSISGKHAFVLRSFRHPKEIALMRHIYKKKFFLIGVSASFQFRADYLRNKYNNLSEEAALNLAIIDKSNAFKNNLNKSLSILKQLGERDNIAIEEASFYTHDINATYCLSDLFLHLSDAQESEWLLKRFLETILGNPFHTPTTEEAGMFLAKAISLRSSDMARQVGAIIMNSKGDVISTGCNEVPKRTGGFYWPERKLDEEPDKDSRDFRFLTKESATKLKEECCLEILKIIEKNRRHSSDQNINMDTLLHELRQSRLVRMKLFEHRTVHAEMAALVSAASRGVSVQNNIMYVTTFPCHDCTKHLIAAGILEVVYLELYPKSEAFRFWPMEVQDFDHIHHGSATKSGLLTFRSFTGVAPRIYLEIFSPKQSREDYFERNNQNKEIVSDIITNEWADLSFTEEHKLREEILFSNLKQTVQKLFIK
ncbi:deaminase [Candidatus Similichlamydia epinepheli]|uniref:deaminase n=1 Tax=Candidatus Similichlamydia epinepheli TaxID=1903953 RepID=UPI000D37B6FA|nr:deaminase [Candidatus Similichlamydia epinepheli]